MIYPISGALHVGTGMGESVADYKRWNVPKVVFVEADERRCNRLQETIKNHDNWTAYCEVLSNKSGETIFYRANNINESGLLEPETLTPLWQNLKTLEQQKRNAINIEFFLERIKDNLHPTSINWVEIDCLPSMLILQGAGTAIENWDVVIGRVVPDDTIASKRGDLGKSALDSFMAKLGFLSVAQDVERNSSIAKILYVRKWKNQSDVQLRLHQAERQRQLDVLLQRADRLSEHLEKQKSETERLRGERDDQVEQLEESRSQIEKMSAEVDQKQRLLERHQTEIESVRRERDGLRKDLTNAEEAVKLSKKQLLLHNSDLENLRGKYKKLTELYETQQETLRQLRTKLLIASKYAHQLQMDKELLPTGTVREKGKTGSAGRKQTIKRDSDAN